jgi:alkaline phosphatase D
MKLRLLLGSLSLFLSSCVLPERSPEAKQVSPTTTAPAATPSAIMAKPSVPAVSPSSPIPATTPMAAAPAKPGVTRYIPKDTFRGLDFGATLQRIAFGSCANQDAPEPIWKSVQADNPDLFLFMGDNVYADRPEQQPIAEQYRKLDLIPEYRSIRSQVPFMATWDDGDLGTNDGGADAPTREVAKKDFLNYWTYAKNSLPLDQIKRGGLFHVKTIGPKNKVVQVIMLDTRYYRSPLHKNPGFTQENKKKYLPSTNRQDTLLGEDQWHFLEAQLRKPANLRLIVSSIQLIANDHSFEKWGNFPLEKQRFYELLKRTGAKNVVVLSGDRHIGTIAKTEVKGWGTLFDITSSSLNRPKDIQEQDSSYIGKVASRENFGLATVDWSSNTAKFEIRGLDNKVENAVEIKLRK